MKKLLSIFLIGFALTASATWGSILKAKYSVSTDNMIALPIEQQQKKDTLVKVVYTCPMHSEVIQDKPGKCPKCKMNLVKKEVASIVYTCPMHPEVIRDKPGKCPKCKMNLVKKEPTKNMEPKK